MNKTKIYLLIFSFLLLLIGCSSPPNTTDTDENENPQIPALGAKESLEIATWNIEWFPKNDKTICSLLHIIRSIDVDLIAVQEISDVTSFDLLVDSLTGWSGVLSGDHYSDNSYQKTGILYKTEFISLSSVKSIFTDDFYSFPRPPLSAFVEIKDTDGKKFDFFIIVIHLKAFSNEEDELRRKTACQNLYTYITNEIASGSDTDFIVMGDWNDQFNDSVKVEALNPFLGKPQEFSFLTWGLDQASFTGYSSLIDHILITHDCLSEYGMGNTEVYYIDDIFPSYLSNVSDHRPVIAYFRGINLVLP